MSADTVDGSALADGLRVAESGSRLIVPHVHAHAREKPLPVFGLLFDTSSLIRWMVEGIRYP
jgi:hypothetical protein